MIFEPLFLVIIVVGVFFYFRLTARIGKLEKENEHIRRLFGELPDQVDVPDIPTIGSAIEPPVPATSRPWDTTKTQPAPPEAPLKKCHTPESFVFTQNNARAFTLWIKENWFYAVAAASLGLAGIFFVQYGIENGLLPPAARVAAATVFGLALISAAEFIRRRSGDHENVSTAYIPSVFAAAGIVSLNGAAYAAYALYGLISPEMGFVAMLVVALAATVLGWFYTSALAAMGIIGALAAPFVMGSTSDVPSATFFYGYVALITLAGLAIDTIKRWAWISVLALLGGMAAAFFSFSQGLGSLEYAGFLAIVTIAACTIPQRAFLPRHAGPGLTQVLRRKFAVLPDFPTRLVVLAFVLAVPQIVFQLEFGEAEFWGAVVISLAIFILVSGVWQSHSIQELALIPLCTFLALLVLAPLDGHTVVDQVRQPQSGLDQARLSWNTTLISLVGLGLLATLSAAFRSLRLKTLNLFWAAVAASAAPAVVVILEIWWRAPSKVSNLNWALFPAGLAIIMILIAQRFAHQDGKPAHRTALALLATLSMWSLAAAIVLTDAALVIMLAGTIAVATLLDRRFDLRLITLFVQIASLVVGYLLLLRVELLLETDAGLWRVIGENLIVFALLAYALRILIYMKRHASVAVVESTLWSHFAIFSGILTYRILNELIPGLRYQSSAQVGIIVSVLLVLMASQLYRREKLPNLKWFRAIIASALGFAALIGLGLNVFAINPVFGFGDHVAGPPVFNSLLLAYALPAAILFAIARKFALRRALRIAFYTVSAILAAIYMGFAIRHVWLGPNISEHQGVHPYELYTYTLALILLGSVLIYLSIARRSHTIRLAGLGAIGLATAKVFLIDASGLDGLTRVFSFLALGLALVGLAWLNRWSHLHINSAAEAVESDPTA